MGIILYLSAMVWGGNKILILMEAVNKCNTVPITFRF